MITRTTRLIRVCTVFTALGLAPVCAQAQTDHGWATGNVVAVTPATDSFVQNVATPFRFETFTGSLGYSFQTQPSFDVGAGLMVSRHVGLGLAVSRLSTSNAAAVSISVPDTLRFNLSASGSAISADALPHSETAIHLEGTYRLTIGRGAIRLFVGPSMIHVRQDVITDVQYTEATTDTTHTLTVTGVTHDRSTDTAFGINLGADGTVYLNKFLGIGGMLRFSRATATIKNVLQSSGARREVDGDLQVGGLAVGGGLRVRF
jgi:hypothetical protein